MIRSQSKLEYLKDSSLGKQVLDMRSKYRNIHVTAARAFIHLFDHGGQENLFSSFAPFVASNCVHLMAYDVSIPLETKAQSSVRLDVEDDYRHLEVKLHHMKCNKDWINHHLFAISVSSVSKHPQLTDESQSQAEEKLTNVR